MPAGNVATLEKVPQTKDEHVWADYLELLALQNLDGEVSKADLIDRIKERKDLSEIKELGNRRIDALDEFITDCFLSLGYRQKAFGDSYPFKVSEGNILKRKDGLTATIRVYVFLLLAANLSYLKPSYYNRITSIFEVVCREALKNYLPTGAMTLHFGKNPLNTDAKYSGKLYKKILFLAEDMNETVLITEGEINPRDSGDRGLDLVGLVPLGDKAAGMLSVFVQCACTEEWITKQYDCSEDAWGKIIRLTARLPHMVFIPFCFRSATGEWFDRLKISKSILVDRVRLINLLISTPTSIAVIPNLEMVDEFLSQQESVI